jgi:hypothetical protein
MRVETSRIIRLALILAMTIAFAVGVRGDGTNRVDKIERFTARTDTLDYEFEVSGGTRTARLQVTARLSSGTAEWALRDPEGEVRLQGWNESAHSRGDTGTMTPKAGTWTLRIGLDDASGEYAARWESK